ncbi:MAG TPA: glycosyltransferase [Terriglobales bacterium]|nr:glycosyltransferase [Terriglobales bacterium]
MNVLHVAPSYFPAFVYGGPIRSTHQMNLGLAARGLTVRVFTTDSNGRERLAESGKTVTYAKGLTVEYERRTFMPDISLSFLWKLPSAIHWADIVHITAVYSFSTIPALGWSALLGKPVFWSPRGALQEWEGSPKRVLKSAWDTVCKLVAGRNTTILAASQREADAAHKRFPKMKVEVLANGVAIPEIVTRTASDKLRLLFLGRLHPIKGIENLIEACALLANEDRSFKLCIAGPAESPYLDTLKGLVKKLQAGGQVEFLGAVSDSERDKLFSEHDILVLPSYSENFGLVVAEALACGVPVIASKHTPWAALEDRGCGMWVENDVGSLHQAIKLLMKSELGAMGNRGREWMRTDFAPEKKLSRLIELYSGGLAGADKV